MSDTLRRRVTDRGADPRPDTELDEHDRAIRGDLAQESLALRDVIPFIADRAARIVTTMTQATADAMGRTLEPLPPT